MLSELDTIVLTRDIKKNSLKKGDTGTIVHAYADGKAFEVEFVTADGKTVALLTLESNEIRPRDKNEILHAREFNSHSATHKIISRSLI